MREEYNHLDDENVKVVDSLDVILRTDFGDVVGIEEPAEVDLGVGVAVVEDHVEELGGGLEDGLLVHLEADGAAVAQGPVGRVIFAHGADQLVLVVLEFLLQHNPELGDSVLLLQTRHLHKKRESLMRMSNDFSEKKPSDVIVLSDF